MIQRFYLELVKTFQCVYRLKRPFYRIFTHIRQNNLEGLVMFIDNRVKR
jgi:hypothetical protein